MWDFMVVKTVYKQVNIPKVQFNNSNINQCVQVVCCNENISLGIHEVSTILSQQKSIVAGVVSINTVWDPISQGGGLSIHIRLIFGQNILYPINSSSKN